MWVAGTQLLEPSLLEPSLLEPPLLEPSLLEPSLLCPRECSSGKLESGAAAENQTQLASQLPGLWSTFSMSCLFSHSRTLQVLHIWWLTTFCEICAFDLQVCVRSPDSLAFRMMSYEKSLRGCSRACPCAGSVHHKPGPGKGLCQHC